MLFLYKLNTFNFLNFLSFISFKLKISVATAEIAFLARLKYSKVSKNELAAILKNYQIDFFDLPKCCPKARKTRTVCFKAAHFVCSLAELLAHLRRTLKLPASEMETGVPIARKLLDKFRKYIIAGIEIEAGDFPGIQEYFTGKEE